MVALPKVVLHDHLDGGLRIDTIIELADAIGHRLPTSDSSELAAWFDQSSSESLEDYLGAFVHTTAVMQTQDAVERVAYEALSDLADDGVVYAELRFDPGLCTTGGLSRFDVVESALAGCARASTESGVPFGLIVSALRNRDDAELAADAAIRFKDQGVVAFDLAGPEAGFPPDAHLGAIRRFHQAGLGVTLHAGEGDGPHSIWRALALCHAHRIGHGVRIVEDTQVVDGSIRRLGAFARRVRDQRIPLEVAITSNVDTGIVPTVDTHPFGALYRAGFNVTINTDNRLMSHTTMSREFACATDLGLSTRDLREVTIAALEAGFGPWPVRRRIIDEIVRPAYGDAVPSPG